MLDKQYKTMHTTIKKYKIISSIQVYLLWKINVYKYPEGSVN